MEEVAVMEGKQPEKACAVHRVSFPFRLIFPC